MKKYIAHLLAVIAIGLSITLFVQNQQQQQRIDTLQVKQKELITAINKAFTTPETSSLTKGTPAPAFSLVDSEGKIINSSEWNTTHKKLLVFSSSECSYCSDFYPELDMYSRLHPQIEVIVIQDIATPEENKKFLETTGYQFKIVAATDQVFNDYKIMETPTSVLIDREHNIETVFVASTMEELAQTIHY